MKYFLTILLSVILFSTVSFGGTKMEIFTLNNGIKVIFKQTKSVEILCLKFHSPISVLQEESSMAMATARAGNVIGGGDWALDRLMPDCVRSINKGIDIEIRNPIAVRPWQHVLEPLSGYLLLGQKLLDEGKKYADGFNFGPNEESVLTVAEVSKMVTEFYGKGKVFVGEPSPLHEAGLLMLNIEKAKEVLSWTPTLTANEAIKNTVDWYKHFYANDYDMYEFTMKQIETYEENIKWNKNYAIK